MSLLHRKKQPWCQKDCSVHHSVLRRQSSALWKYTGPICACAPITLPHAIRFHIPTSSTSAARLTASTQPVAQPATQPPTQGKMKALRNCSFGNFQDLLPLEIDQPAFSEAVARVQLPWKSTRTHPRVHTSEHETKYYMYTYIYKYTESQALTLLQCSVNVIKANAPSLEVPLHGDLALSASNAFPARVVK